MISRNFLEKFWFVTGTINDISRFFTWKAKQTNKFNLKNSRKVGPNIEGLSKFAEIVPCIKAWICFARGAGDKRQVTN